MHPSLLKRSCVLWALPFLAVAQGVLPPAPPPAATDQQFRFSTGVQMVMLQATVLNRRGSFVNGLVQNNFRVYENEKQQKIGFFLHRDTPVAVGLIVDNSGSMRRKHAAVLAAAKTFAKNSNPKDELFVVSFNEKATLGLPRAKLYSSSSKELERALPATAGGGKSALYDALELGLKHVHELRQDKKALILISDGGDNASSITEEQIVRDATNSDVLIFTIGLFGHYAEETDPAFLKKLANVTGGEAFLPGRPGQASNNCKRIAQTIRNGYTIGYSPNNEYAAGTFRAIKLEATKARMPNLVARTRIGYTPQSSP